MAAQKNKIVLLMCNNCKGMTDKLLPEIHLHFMENIHVLPVECPSQVDAFAVIRMLKNCADGVIIACPRNACCCPSNKKSIRRWELVKDMLPIFGYSREQLQIASVSPLDGKKLTNMIDQMLVFINLSKTDPTEANFLSGERYFVQTYKWLN